MKLILFLILSTGSLAFGRIEPESVTTAELYRALPRLSESLGMNLLPETFRCSQACYVNSVNGDQCMLLFIDDNQYVIRRKIEAICSPSGNSNQKKIAIVSRSLKDVRATAANTGYGLNQSRWGRSLHLNKMMSHAGRCRGKEIVACYQNYDAFYGYSCRCP